MRIEAAIQLSAGGPGSGRHPEYGQFSHTSGPDKAGKGKTHTYRSPNGAQAKVWTSKDKGIVYYNDNPGKASVPSRTGFAPASAMNQKLHEGTKESANKFMKNYFGIE